MKNPGKLSKKALTYVRPEFGKFTLTSLPGQELSFRKFTVDDYAWVQETFGAPLEQLTGPGATVQLSTLCRIWFQALSDESKVHFMPQVESVVDYETGKVEDVVHPGWKRFMKTIESREIELVASSFAVAMISSKPLEEWPDDLKKNLQAMRGMTLAP
jgi:hypothetical protein